MQKRDGIFFAFAMILLAVNVSVAEKSAVSSRPSLRSFHSSASQPCQVENCPEELSVTQHQLIIGGSQLAYTATTGYMRLEDESGKPQANIFFVAYTKDVRGTSNEKMRPVTFAFNGGPGAASIFLHFGAMGPRRVVFPSDGRVLPRFVQLVDNEFTWLTFTDLVFIDPVGTGYSRAAAGVDPKQFFEVEGDIRSIGRFINLYLTGNQRWLSPIFLAGESYGTTRAAGLANYLQNSLGIYPRGVVLISSVLDFQTILYDAGNDMPYPLALPSFTATAWYHRKLAPNLQADLTKALAEAEQFALTDYVTALAQGDALPPDQADKIADKLAAYSGLSKKFILLNNLRVSSHKFVKELLRSQNRMVGLMDGRVVGIDVRTAGEYSRFDPSFFLSIGPLNAAMNDYVRRELGYRNNLPYEYLSNKAHQAWNFKTKDQGYLNEASALQEALTRNNSLKVMVASGYFDLTTPYFATVYTLNHLGLDPVLRKNIVFNSYMSGHQAYTDFQSLRKLNIDAETFFKAATNSSEIK